MFTNFKMEAIKGISLPYLPFDNLTKVCDLLEYEGPIFSHYRDSNGKNYLHYWVDYSEEFNRWIVWNVGNELLYDYLHGREPLFSLLNDSPYVFVIDVDAEVEYHNLTMVPIGDLPKSYFPSHQSWYKFEVPQIYTLDTPSIAPNSYIQTMRDSACIFKLSTNSLKYSKSVRAKNAGTFLLDISQSFGEYAKADFYEKYRNDFSDIEKLNKVLINVSKAVEPLMVDVKFNSFEVLVNIDSLSTYYGDSKEYANWRRSLIENYHNEIIDIDYSSDASLEKIKTRFPDDTLRNKIVKPIINILTNEDYRLETKKINGGKRRIHNHITKKRYKEILTPKFEEVSIVPDRKKLLNIIVEVKEKDGITIFTTKDLSKNVLFQKEESEVELSFEYLTKGNIEIIFKTPLKYKYFIDEENLNHITCEEFGVDIYAESKSDVYRLFQKNLIETIFLWIDSGSNLDIIENYIEEIRNSEE